MPRSRSSGGRARSGGMFGGFGGRKSASRPGPVAPRRQQQAPPPAQPQTAPPPATGSSSGGGFMSTIAQGFAFGTGSAVAHRAVGAVAGSLSGEGGAEEHAPHASEQPQAYSQQQQQQQQNPCYMYEQDFQRCLENNQGQLAECQFYFDSLRSCQADNRPAFQ